MRADGLFARFQRSVLWTFNLPSFFPLPFSPSWILLRLKKWSGCCFCNRWNRKISDFRTLFLFLLVFVRKPVYVALTHSLSFSFFSSTFSSFFSSSSPSALIKNVLTNCNVVHRKVLKDLQSKSFSLFNRGEDGVGWEGGFLCNMGWGERSKILARECLFPLR